MNRPPFNFSLAIQLGWVKPPAEALQPARRRPARRERQSVWCCGVNYQRWRFVTRDWPGTHYTHCCTCGRALPWPAKQPYHRPNPRRASREAKRREAAKFTAQGLTTRGTVRRRSPNLLPSQRPDAQRRRTLANWRKRSAAFTARGLTTRGTVRRRAMNGSRNALSLTEAAWRALRAAMNIERPDHLTFCEREAA